MLAMDETDSGLLTEETVPGSDTSMTPAAAAPSVCLVTRRTVMNGMYMECLNSTEGLLQPTRSGRTRSWFHIPDGMDSADAAPLMCAGATVFNAIHAHGVEPAHRVGIVGVGGLGHLCIMVCFAFASFIFCLLISRPVRSEDGLRGRCILQP
jgi:NADPH:quinone reductase-like Zn-dependent oxidoreductase